MNKRGQISFDLLISMLILVIFIGAATTIAGEMRENNEKIVLENQLRILVEDYAATVNSVIAFSGMEEYEVKIKIDKVTYGGAKIVPKLKVDGNELIIFLDNYDKEFSSIVSSSIKNKIEITGDYIVVSG